MQALIISGFFGVGKTTACLYLRKELKVIDLDFTLLKVSLIRYIELIIDSIKKYDIIFISCNENIRKSLRKLKINYYVVYPTKNRKSEFIENFILRQNSKTFINFLEENFYQLIESIENDGFGKKIPLAKEGEFLLNNNLLNKLIYDKIK